MKSTWYQKHFAKVKNPTGDTSESLPDLKSLLQQFGKDERWITQKIQELSPEKSTIESVLAFTELFSTDSYDRRIRQIKGILQEIGCTNSASLQKLAEYLFAEIYVGHPQIDPSLI